MPDNRWDFAEELQRPCAAQHFGVWAVLAREFDSAVEAVRAGLWPVLSAEQIEQRAQKMDEGYTLMSGGIALHRLSGFMQKGISKFGGASTIAVRRGLRAATANPDVKGNLLVVDSPGGTVAGTQELYDDVRAADAQKPTMARIEDMGASAAYYAAAGARRISANPAAQVGSIGTYAVLVDDSEAAGKAGVKVHKIASGPYKGAGEPGTQITDEQLVHYQEIVNTLADQFRAAVKAGRHMSAEQVRAVSDGRVWVGKDALTNGLIDAVEPFDATIRALQREIKQQNATPRRDAAYRRMRLSE